jgi:hypothetical protein
LLVPVLLTELTILAFAEKIGSLLYSVHSYSYLICSIYLISRYFLF